MKLSYSEEKEFIRILRKLLENEKVYEMTDYIQHGNTSTFTHCLIVAYYSYLLALRLNSKCDIQSLVRGAMLHDFYLYDWHIPDQSHKLHGFFHPKLALKNARKYFTLNSIERDIIEKHMWPLTLSKMPIYREAFLVCFVDKFVSLAETLYITTVPKNYSHLKSKLLTKKLI